MSIAADLNPSLGPCRPGKGGERNPKSMVFLIVLWLAMFIAMTVLLVLIVTTLIQGIAAGSAAVHRVPGLVAAPGRRTASDSRLHLGDRHHCGAGDSPRCRGGRPARGVCRQDKTGQPSDRGQCPEPGRHPIGGLRSLGAGRADTGGGAEQEPGHPAEPPLSAC